MPSSRALNRSGTSISQWQPGLIWQAAATVLSLAFVALCLEQVIHELSHGLATLAVGAEWVAWSFWRSSSTWDSTPADHEGREAIIAGSAAVVNIIVAVACMLLMPRLRGRPVSRLLVLYLGAYSLFAGFGYLFIDPLFAGDESTGDWARVTMYLGGSWAIRLAIFAIGLAGTIFGYFWLGQAALRFTFAGIDNASRSTRIRTGIILLIVPYVGVNIIFTLLALTHPEGTDGLASIALKVWFGFIGFFWAFMINYVWRPYKGPFSEMSTLPAGIRWPIITAAVATLIVVLAFFIPGVES